MEVRVFGSVHEAAPLWSHIEEGGHGLAFQTLAWQSAWAETLAEAESSVACPVAVLDADGTPHMLLPLAVQRRAGTRCLTFAGGALCDYHAPLLANTFTAPEDVPALWRRVRESVPAHDAVAIERQPPTIGSISNPLFELGGAEHSSASHYATLQEDFDAFLAAKRSPRTLSTERRKRRKLEKLGSVRYVTVRSANEIEPVLAAMMRQKSALYRELGVRDYFAEAPYRNFVKKLTEQHVASGLVHLSALYVGEDIAATHWGLFHRGRFYYLLPAYERDARTRHSPGNALLHELLADCCARGVDVFDFTVGDEPYKLQWRDGEMPLRDRYAATTARGALYVLPKRVAVAAKTRIKRSPGLMRWALRVRSLGQRRQGSG